mgnify:CR=1 FL=1
MGDLTAGMKPLTAEEAARMRGSLITLNGGMTVPAAVIVLGNGLERRGITLTRDGETLKVRGSGGQKADLTAEDIAGIKRYKAHLLALIDYQAPDPA